MCLAIRRSRQASFPNQIERTLKKILFLTGTRADFGKLKSLISVLDRHPNHFEVELVVTGMHLNPDFGNTHLEVERSFPKLTSHLFNNHDDADTMDQILAKTVQGLSSIIRKCSPDLFVIHGDRVEALAGAISGALNNVLVAHIEGGEISGTIDELIRHATTKMAHVHLVANENAKANVIQLGENPDSVFVIGSPDLDVMNSDTLPTLEEVKKYYEIEFEDYGIVIFHPVTTNLYEVDQGAKILEQVMANSNRNFIVIMPNNDSGSSLIIDRFNKLKERNNVRLFKSLRFEYFLVLLRESGFIMGNSSAGVREAPHFGVPCINIGTRQHNRVIDPLIVDIVNPTFENISNALENLPIGEAVTESLFGDGSSDERFFDILENGKIWDIPIQKVFVRLNRQ